MCFLAEVVDAAVSCVALGRLPYYEVQYINLVEADTNIYESIYDNYQGCIEDVLHRKYAASYNIVFDRDKLNVYRYIYNNVCVISEKTRSYIDSTKDKMMWPIKGKILGVSYRGTDFKTLKPKGHPIQPSVEELMEKVEEFMNEYEYIYITSDEKKVIEQFKQRYPRRVLAMDREYYDSFYSYKDVKWVTQVSFERENDTYLKGIEYFTSVYLLAQCDALVGGLHGATRAAMIMKDVDYSQVFIFNKGYFD